MLQLVKRWKVAGAAVVMAGVVGAAGGRCRAATVSTFADNFENGYGQWVDRAGGTYGVIVNDPLRAGNHVLSFAHTGTMGSVFSNDLITTTGQFTVSFDYLGQPSGSGTSGGFFGVSLNTAPANTSQHTWFAGTISGFTAPYVLLKDDGKWNSYTLTFTSPIGQPVHLMFEDYNGADRTAGNAFFDNVRFNDASVSPAVPAAPLPGTAAAGVVGLAVAGLAVRRKRSGLKPMSRLAAPTADY